MFRLIARLESDADFGIHLLILDYFILFHMHLSNGETRDVMIYDVVDSMLRQQEYLGNSNLCFHIIRSYNYFRMCSTNFDSCQNFRGIILRKTRSIG